MPCANFLRKPGVSCVHAAPGTLFPLRRGRVRKQSGTSELSVTELPVSGNSTSVEAIELAVATDGGTPVTFEQVYNDCVGFVWRTAKRLGVEDSAVDDVCQEVFVIVHRRLSEFEGRSSLKTWIYGILANVVRTHRRGLQRKSPAHRSLGPVLNPDDIAGSSGEDPHELTGASQAAEVAKNLLSKMDEDKRIVFVLAELEEMPTSEIAECLDVNINTIYARLRAARKQFTQLAERYRAQDKWRM